MPAATDSITDLAINTIRTLSMDGVQAANSGHPGTPMSLAPVAYKLWADVLRYDPQQPLWPNRDRFVLSAGHASMLIYSLIHLAGIRKTDDSGAATDEPALTIGDLKQFRQWGSLTAGHPEYGHTSGVETTTGPLGQGCANTVGMAIASRWLAARYNRPGYELFGFNAFALCGDGDMMEGISNEAASLAGHLKLSNLCWIYDDNSITIEGSTSLAFSEDVGARFRALGWEVLYVDDANDLEALGAAYQKFLENDERPTMIVVKSVIGYGAPNKAGTHDAHGAPLGDEEIAATKKAYGWPEDQKFLVPEGVPVHFDATLGQRGSDARAAWDELFAAYANEYPQEAEELERMRMGDLPEGWDAAPLAFEASEKGDATRNSGGKALNHFAQKVPWLIGGSADLAPSNKTMLTFDGAGHFSADDYSGRNFHFGIREHAMAAAANGMALCGVRPYVGTFFVFSDYLRPSMRLAAIMNLPVVYVFTHDSIGVGEDGPTHQPVEHLAAARSIPGLVVIRPADANESVAAWRAALASTNRPVAVILTRQNLPTLDRSVYPSADLVAKGAYVLSDAPDPKVILIATGSEVPIALQAQAKLADAGVPARVVNMPSMELFEDQPKKYRDEVLPPAITARVGVEAATRQGWDRYIGSTGDFVGMSGFGSSGPFKTVFEKFGITADAIVEAAKKQIG